jgi:probable F420-dependent oxidoreductase
MAQIKVAVGTYGIENLFRGDFRQVIETVQIADRMGLDQMVITDHVVMGERTDRYPYGKFPVPPEYPWFEPMTTMAVIAGATKNIRVSTSVMIAPLRPAVLLAKQAATLDVLSGGRLDLGVGTGWQREEYEASGIPFEDRGRRLEDQLRACRVLWREAPASFESETVSFEKVYCRPAPAQEGGVPLWLGLAPTPVNCRRIAEFGTGWIPINPHPAAITDGVTRIRAAFEAAGRDPAELRVRALLQTRVGEDGAPDLEKSLATLDRSVAAGVTHIEILPYLFVQSAEQLAPLLERIARIKG